MRASVYYKDTHFILENVEEVKVIRIQHPETKGYRKYIIFDDTEFSELIYPIGDIKRLYIYKS